MNMYCIYDSPSDYPGEYVARRFLVGPGGETAPQEIVARAPSLEELYRALPQGMTRVPRQPNEDPVIVETWIDASTEPKDLGSMSDGSESRLPTERVLRYEFPGERGAPTSLQQRCEVYPDIDAALNAAITYVQATNDTSEFETPAELAQLQKRLENEQRLHQERGESFWQSLHSGHVLPKQYLFRGQANWDWALLPSMFQGLDWGPLPWADSRLQSLADAVRERRSETEAFKAALLEASKAGKLPAELMTYDESQLELTARHYGFPSFFFDFTTNLKTAAFFATQQAFDAEIGILYVLNLQRLNDAFGVSAVSSDGENSVSVRYISSSPQLGNGKKVDLPSLSGVLFSMKTVPLSRVQAQNAVFLDAIGTGSLSREEPRYIHDEYWLWYVLDYLSSKFCFRQTGKVYESAESRVTQQDLLSKKDAFRDFASSWKQRR